MKRRVSLYIGGAEVDLGADTLVLMNWAATDLDNPAVVRNSYSRTVTLPGTQRNDRVFSSAFRADRTGGAGYDTNARVPFTIIDEAGECPASGYAKLDAVTREGAAVSYRVSLYGGLGGFFYALSADADGNRRNLASLAWLGGGDAELNFTINAATVAEAWDEGHVNPLWDVLNFAPAYNGIPDGDFDAAHAVADPDDLAYLGDLIPAGYGGKDGHVLVTLGKAVDEWAAKDLRSYLQRPVLSMTAFLNAIASPENNGGYEVDASDVMGDVSGLWMTLPTIPSLGSFRKAAAASDITPGVTVPADTSVWQRFSVSPALEGDLMCTASVSALPVFASQGAAASAALIAWNDPAFDDMGQVSGIATVIFMQAIAYRAGVVVGASPVAVLVDTTSGAAEVAARVGFTPWETPTGSDAWYAPVTGVTFTKTGGQYVADRSVTLTVKGRGIDAVEVRGYATTWNVASGFAEDYPLPSAGALWRRMHDGNLPWLLTPVTGAAPDTIVTTGSLAQEGSAGSSITVDDWSQPLRSGARVTKEMLLSGDKSPADYLIGLAQTFGWVFIQDTATRKVTICKRDTFYDGTTVDLSDRVDVAQPVTITPRAAASRWYDFKVADVGGTSAKEYEGVYGLPYGAQRVDTGYPFNDEPVDVLRATPFKGAVTILDRGPYWNIITQGGKFVPSPFVDAGAKMTCWATADGASQEVDIPQPLPTATVDYYNARHNGYDRPYARKCEFRDGSGKPVDGQDVLLRLDMLTAYDAFRVTDDVAAMDTLNGGKACWLLGDTSAVTLDRIPIFSRYQFAPLDSDLVYRSLDFGVPRELFIPDITYPADATMYASKWKAYIADRYGRDTKVLRCRADLSGIRPGADLLRHFYYFDGALWVMNAVSNYPLTSDDLPEVELVQVQDKDAYTNGQE